jgi:hypothetical protein
LAVVDGPADGAGVAVVGIEIGLLAWLAVESAVPTVSRAWARLLDLDLGGSLGRPGRVTTRLI